MLLEVELDATACADNAPKKCAEKRWKSEINLEENKIVNMDTGDRQHQSWGVFQYLT